MKPNQVPAPILAPGTFAGAPLDAIKLIAALLMVADHINTIFLGNHASLLWKIGRIVYPLFCFALVCNIQRGTSVTKYLATLLVAGAVAQPFYAGALDETDGNILFTLAVGIAIIAALREQSLVVQHVVLCIGVVAIFTPLAHARSGLDFGLAGMLFPPALYLVLAGRWSHAIWLALLLIGLNWQLPDPWRLGPLTNAAIAAVGSIAIVLLCSRFKGYPRFLPRYALHIFYPAHLLVLGALHGWS